MAFLRHIQICNRHDLGNFIPLFCQDQRFGWLHRRWEDLFFQRNDIFVAQSDGLKLHPNLDTPAKRSAAIADLFQSIAHPLPRPRHELFAVATGWGETPLFEIERAYASILGIRAYGVHVNGLVRRHDEVWLWIAKRAANRPVEPGKWDNMIAGGQPSHLSLHDNVLKEAAEEANVPPDLALTAKPVGLVSYCMEDEWGLKPDTLFCFDLFLPPDFQPRNTDGEIESFALCPLSEIAQRIQTRDDFKFNVNLVIIDLLIRHSYLHPDQHQDYYKLVSGLRQEPLSG